MWFTSWFPASLNLTTQMWSDCLQSILCCSTFKNIVIYFVALSCSYSLFSPLWLGPKSGTTDAGWCFFICVSQTSHLYVSNIHIPSLPLTDCVLASSFPSCLSCDDSDLSLTSIPNYSHSCKLRNKPSNIKGSLWRLGFAAMRDWVAREHQSGGGLQVKVNKQNNEV